MLTTAKDVIAVDFEFRMANMRPPEIRCMSALSLKTGQRWDYWANELPGEAPFRFDQDGQIIYLMHFGEAECACFLALGWGTPAFIFDSSIVINQLRARPQKKINGIKILPPPFNRGSSLVGTLESFCLEHPGKAIKEDMRALAMLDKRSNEYTDLEKRDLMAYCRTDIDPYIKLLPAILSEFERIKYDWHIICYYSGYVPTYARMTRTGIPIDLELWKRVRRRWPEVRDQFRTASDPYGFMRPSGEIDRGAIGRFLNKYYPDHLWPAKPTSTGELDVSDKALEDAGLIWPEIENLRQAKKLYKALESMRRPDSGVQVAPDGRARCYFAPCKTLSSRGAPNNFIFSASKALRHFIRPPAGMAIASLDFSSQEFLIAAALSGDAGMLNDYAEGDVYLAFAKRIKLVPPKATKDSHPAERFKAKTLVLGIGYGMSAYGLRIRLGISIDEAERLIKRYWEAYPVYQKWRGELTDVALARGLELADGWRLMPTLDQNPLSVRNFPMQGTGTDILRKAIREFEAAGIQMIGTNHDSIIIQAQESEIEAKTAAAKRLMIHAGRSYLAGHDCRVDIEQIIYHSDHWDSDGGRGLYKKLIEVCA